MFDDLGRPELRLRRVATRLAQPAPLPQEVPVPVECDLDICQASGLCSRELPFAEQPVLLGHHALDTRQDRGVDRGFARHDDGLANRVRQACEVARPCASTHTVSSATSPPTAIWPHATAPSV